MVTERLVISPEDWSRIRNLFLRYGFSPEEAIWAANNNLDPLGEKKWQIRKLLRNRGTKVRVLIKVGRIDRKTAIQWCEEESKRFAREKGEEESNLFQGASP